MPKGKKIPEKIKQQIRYDKLENPELTHQELGIKYNLSRQAITNILNHKVINAIKNAAKHVSDITTINRVDDLLLILSDAIFKIKYETIDATQARALGFLVKTYFDILVNKSNVKEEAESYDLSSLSIEELQALAEDQS